MFPPGGGAISALGGFELINGLLSINDAMSWNSGGAPRGVVETPCGMSKGRGHNEIPLENGPFRPSIFRGDVSFREGKPLAMSWYNVEPVRPPLGGSSHDFLVNWPMINRFHPHVATWDRKTLK